MHAVNKYNFKFTQSLVSFHSDSKKNVSPYLCFTVVSFYMALYCDCYIV